ncbi:MAG: hypothetical protein ABWX92_18465 [Mycetocola sp.]
MSKRAFVVVPALLVLVLGGCAGPAADEGSNPLKDFEKVIDLIPWAKSIAGDASAEHLTARIAEITAGLPSLNIPDATRADVAARLKAVSDSLLADPSNTAAAVTELNAVIDEVKAAVQ